MAANAIRMIMALAWVVVTIFWFSVCFEAMPKRAQTTTRP